MILLHKINLFMQPMIFLFLFDDFLVIYALLLILVQLCGYSTIPFDSLKTLILIMLTIICNINRSIATYVKITHLIIVFRLIWIILIMFFFLFEWIMNKLWFNMIFIIVIIIWRVRRFWVITLFNIIFIIWLITFNSECLTLLIRSHLYCNEWFSYIIWTKLLLFLLV